jgi:hypothetical protein
MFELVLRRSEHCENRFAILSPLLNLEETKQPSIKPQLFPKLVGIECKPVLQLDKASSEADVSNR